MTTTPAAIDPTVGSAQASELATANREWQRFRWNVDNGHLDYVTDAQENYRYFRGRGGQWRDADRQYMESIQGRKCLEINGIQPAVLTAVGEQIATRTEVCYRPAKGEATKEVADVLTALAMHIMEKNDFPRREKQTYRNGLIKRRGYFDVRMDFSENAYGEVQIRDLDPICVIPDMFSKGYDPAEWKEVTTFSWLSYDQIEGLYGKAARDKAEAAQKQAGDRPFSDEFLSENRIDSREGFGRADNPSFQAYSLMFGGEIRLRVIERQYYQYALRLHFVDPATGELEPVPDGIPLAQAQAQAQALGKLLRKINMKRVRWVVTTRFAVLHDDWSPYRSFTILPYFYLFDYGDTLSMVDPAISPQDLLNKATTATLHYLTTVANSGWQMEEEQLVGMTPDDLRGAGMKSGLVLVRKKGSAPLEKIAPNIFPTGMDRMADKGEAYIKTTTGMSDAEQGLQSPEVSGVALAGKQWQSKLSLADGKDNLAHTRTLVGRKLLELFQDFYSNERVYQITGKDLYGREEQKTLVINRTLPDGSVHNDITLGIYDVAVSAQPLAATFQETQYKQALEMKESGIAIPDDEIVRQSNLANKDAIADRLAAPKENSGADALNQAKAELALAQARAADATATNTQVQAMFGAVNSGRQVALLPAIAPLADQILLSAGFKDQNGPPAIPAPQQALPVGIGDEVPRNTSPNYPPVADRGELTGVEGGH